MEILVADDDIYSGKILKKILETSGHTAVLAEDGNAAWKLFNDRSFKMVITDWMMPGLEGPELCRKIRDQKLTHYVYILLLTARDKKEDAVTGLEAGADDFVVKPFEPDELLARIRSGQRIVQLEDEHKKVQIQLLQSEKMSSIGQLAAGVAHEINNPTGFVSSNLKTLADYSGDAQKLIQRYQELLKRLCPNNLNDHNSDSISIQAKKILAYESEIDIDFILKDVPDLIHESREGMERIKKIVMDLKDFAHPGEHELKAADINENIDSTLNIVWNEIKYKAEVQKDYGDLPFVKCYPQQINQVFMNLLVNAAQAIEDKGTIHISTASKNGRVTIRISDSGRGIPKENVSRIFDPFYTTKDVGNGTGLGLNVAYHIIEKHNGIIEVESEIGKGTIFTVKLPIDGPTV